MPDSNPAVADSNPAGCPKCPASARNGVRRAAGMVSAITPESRPSWTGARISTASPILLPSGRTIRLITAPVFIATKFEAFKGRGNGDYLVSHDLEDIVTVVDGRPALVDELRSSPEELRAYVTKEISSLLDTPEFLDALPGHLPGDSASQSRVPALTELFERIAQL